MFSIPEVLVHFFLKIQIFMIFNFAFRALGAGKSVLLREIINAMRVKHSRSPEAVAITASTGWFILSFFLWCVFITV